MSMIYEFKYNDMYYRRNEAGEVVKIPWGEYKKSVEINLRCINFVE